MLFSSVDKAVGTALGLIALYLLLANPKGVSELFGSIGKFSVGITGALQGRSVSGFDGVTVR